MNRAHGPTDGSAPAHHRAVGPTVPGRSAWLTADTVRTARRNLTVHRLDQDSPMCRGCAALGITAEWPCYSAAVAREVIRVAMAVGAE